MRSLKKGTAISLVLVMACLTTSCSTKYVNATVYPNSNFAPGPVTVKYLEEHKDEIPDEMIEDLAKCKQASEITEALQEGTDVTSFDPGPTWAWVSGLGIAAWVAVKTLIGGVFSWFI